MASAHTVLVKLHNGLVIGFNIIAKETPYKPIKQQRSSKYAHNLWWCRVLRLLSPEKLLHDFHSPFVIYIKQEGWCSV